MGLRTLAMTALVLTSAFVSSGRADDGSLSWTDSESRIIATAGESQFVSQVSMTPEAADGSTWVLVAPYGWVPGMRGTVGAAGITANVDLSIGDVIRHLGDLNGAFMGHVEVGKNQWGLVLDGMLMRLEPEQNLPLGGKVKLESSSTLLESLAMLRLVDTQTIDPALPRTRIDALGGARYYQVQSGFQLNPAVGPVVRDELTKDWVDVVVGGRAAVTVLEGLDGFIRADFGGFGIGTSSNLTW